MTLGKIQFPTSPCIGRPENPRYPFLWDKLELAYFPHFGPRMFDYSQHHRHIASVNGSPAYNMTRLGRCYEGSGSEHIDCGATSAGNHVGHIDQGHTTIFFCIDYAGITPSSNRYYFGAGEAGNTAYWFAQEQYAIPTADKITPRLEMHDRFPGTGIKIADITNALSPADGPFCFGIRVNYVDISDSKWFVNGDPVDTTTYDTSTNETCNTSRSIKLMARDHNAPMNFLVGRLGTFLWWDRLLTDAEHRILGTVPFALLLEDMAA